MNIQSDPMASGAPGFLEDYLPYLLRRADQALSSEFYRLLNGYGVGRSDWRVLAVLEDLGQLSILDLTAASLSPQPTVTHAVGRLAERGLVKRSTGTADKQQRFVAITPAGRQLTATLIEEAKRLEAEALAEAGDLSDLVANLRQLTAVIEARSDHRADEQPDAG